LKGNRTKMLRNRVAQEAALLLYTSQEKEYKQAKLRASATLGVRVLPSNLEVAEELDIIADEREGPQRKNLLLQMRKEAKQIMEALSEFNPVLIGSVWRGTARKDSDIDISVFSEKYQQVLEHLQNQGYAISQTERRSVTKAGNKTSSVHIQVVLDSADIAEIAVRSPQQLGKTEKCETYGDLKTGLNLKQLTKVLETAPFQKFVPF
jgi:predicted nucleotidyltransferase